MGHPFLLMTRIVDGKGGAISAYTALEIGGIMIKSAPQRRQALKASLSPGLVATAAVGPIAYWLWNLEVACYATTLFALVIIAVNHQRRRHREK